MVPGIDAVSVKPFFPITISNPYLEEVKWNESRTTVSLQWRGFTKSTETEECFYRIKIPGGKNGIKNEAGEYLEEEMCEIVKCYF